MSQTMNIQYFGKYLIIAGLVLLCLGIILQFVDKIPFLGKLPGDFYIKRENFQFYFPLTTMILISAVLTLIIYLYNKFK